MEKPSGAKAPRIFNLKAGTAKAAPFQSSIVQLSFFATLKL